MEETPVKKEKNNKILFRVMIMLVSVASLAAIIFLYKIPDVRAIQTAVILAVGQIAACFSFDSAKTVSSILVDDDRAYRRFFITYALLLLVVIILPAMPVTVWPFVLVYVLLTIISDMSTGIIAGSMCLFLAGSAVDASVYPYIYVYIVTGIIAAVVVSRLDENYRIALPVAIIETVLLGGLGATLITAAGKISIELLIYPVVNAVITLILTIFMLKAYSARVIFKRKDKYIELNDPECLLLSELKNVSPADYHKTVHIVYFCDRVASSIGLDAARVKCAGLYHRVGVIGGEYSWENTKAVCEEQNLPEDVMDILKEFEDSKTPIRHAETAVLYMSECVVSSIQYLFAKNKEIKLDYPSLIETIFTQRTETGVFKDCDISIRQFEQMKKVFVEEKLYYDFLR